MEKQYVSDHDGADDDDEDEDEDDDDDDELFLQNG